MSYLQIEMLFEWIMVFILFVNELHFIVKLFSFNGFDVLSFSLEIIIKLLLKYYKFHPKRFFKWVFKL